MTTDLVAKIKARGYWTVIVRPSAFDRTRIPDIRSLYPLVQQSSVQLRGWDFPHIDVTQAAVRGQDWSGQKFDWELFVEAWRIYQSGQFVYISGFVDDWRDQSTLWPPSSEWMQGTNLSVPDVVWRFTEIYEFASRLIFSDYLGDVLEIRVGLGNLQNRVLQLNMPGRIGFLQSRQFSADGGFTCSPVVANREELGGNARALGLKSAVELFERFNWDTSVEQLRDLQVELLRQ